jgi:hypothetical protein
MDHYICKKYPEKGIELEEGHNSVHSFRECLLNQKGSESGVKYKAPWLASCLSLIPFPLSVLSFIYFYFLPLGKHFKTTKYGSEKPSWYLVSLENSQNLPRIMFFLCKPGGLPVFIVFYFLFISLHIPGLFESNGGPM